MKLKHKPILADKIANILTTAPTYSDPENDSDLDTSAKVTQQNYVDDEDNDDELLSKFRTQNVDLLADLDERYAGKKATRQNFQESDESSIDEDTQDAVSADSDDSEDNHSNAVKSSDEEEYEDEETDEDDPNSDIDDEENEETEDNFNHMSKNDVSMQVKKGLCVRNQLSIWESLLEMRIQLQKSLIAANKMPPSNKYKEIKKEMGREFSDKVSETKTNFQNLLDKLMLLQSLVQKKYPETKNIHRKNEKKSEPSEDEEIPSDTDEEEVPSGRNEDEDEKPPLKKRKVISEYEKDISESFKLYKPYRNEVIQKWHEKTRLILMKSNAVSQSIVDHIEHTLSDRAKLVKRTQLKRSEYNIIGEDNEDGNADKDGDEDDNRRINQIYNTEIFDDDDFYHQLLRELIEMKSADLTDPVQLGRQWIQLQNLRSKMKRKIDTKATKGRKIRYTVHTKLVNFMAPIDENNWTDQAKNELFSSLFGKKQVISSEN